MRNDVMVFGNRLAMLRKKAGLTQLTFGREFSGFLGMNKTYSQLTISSWENGNRLPPTNVLRALALYFNTTSDYLLGLSDVMYKDEPNIIKDKMENAINYMITKERYEKFDKEPVYVTFEDHLYVNRWGIMDWPMKRVVFADKAFRLDSKVRYTLYARMLEGEKDPGYRMKKALSMTQLLEAKGEIWIEMRSCEGLIKGKYNGWFHHNENHTALINAKGLTLPYEGLDIGYTAYPSEVR